MRRKTSAGPTLRRRCRSVAEVQPQLIRILQIPLTPLLKRTTQQFVDRQLLLGVFLVSGLQPIGQRSNHQLLRLDRQFVRSNCEHVSLNGTRLGREPRRQLCQQRLASAQIVRNDESIQQDT